jgi:hypothetical protein
MNHFIFPLPDDDTEPENDIFEPIGSLSHKTDNKRFHKNFPIWVMVFSLW